MDVLFLLLPIGIVFLVLAIVFFFWAIKNGQYDDFESQALKVVIDDHQKTKDNLSVNAEKKNAAADAGKNKDLK